MAHEEDYIRKLQTLHSDSIPGRWPKNTCGKAPHKPLLLFCVLDLYQEMPGRENRIEPTLYIEQAFNDYWSRIFSQTKSTTFATPFFHLKHDGFWSLEPLLSHGVIDSASAKSATALRKNVAFAKLDAKLHALFQKPEWNRHLRSTMISTCFAPGLHGRLIASLKN